MTTVILAEKPDQAETYFKALNNGIGDFKQQKRNGFAKLNTFLDQNTIITWALGHLVTLQMPQNYETHSETMETNNLPFLPAPNKLKYEIIEDKKRQFGIVKKQLTQADVIWTCTDPDREGENIAQLIYLMAGVNNTPKKRLWINSLSDNVIRSGFKNPQDIDTQSIFNESNTRMKADYLVGMNFTELFTAMLQNKGLDGIFSIGRVQTPTNSEIVKNDLAIKKFVVEKYKMIQVLYNYNNQKFSFTSPDKYFDFAELDTIVSKHNFTSATTGTVSDIESSDESQLSPKLFDLSDIQGTANKLWKYTGKETLNTIQELYEKKKLLSYPRTDIDTITINEFNYLKKLVPTMCKILEIDTPTDFNQLSPNPRYVSDKQAEHTALIPTENLMESSLDGLTTMQTNILTAIVRRTLLMFADPFQYLKSKITLTVNGLPFTTTEKMIKNLGWKKYDIQSQSDKPMLPKLEIGNTLEIAPEIILKNTTPPARLTEKSLIGKTGLLKKLNLGTPATRADLIEKLKKRQYVRIEKNEIYPTKLGYLIYELTSGTLLGKAEMTGKWETYLNAIGKGQASKDKFTQNIYKFIDLTIKELLSSNYDNNATLNEIIASKNKVIADITFRENRYNYVHTNEQGAEIKIPKEFSGYKLKSKDITNLITKGRTEFLENAFKSKKTKKKFSAYMLLKNNNVSLEFKTNEPTDSLEINNYSITKFDRFYKIIKAGNSFSLPTTFCQTVISTKILTELLSSGSTKEFIEFTSKKNKKFNAKLQLDSKNSLKLKFED